MAEQKIQVSKKRSTQGPAFKASVLAKQPDASGPKGPTLLPGQQPTSVDMGNEPFRAPIEPDTNE